VTVSGLLLERLGTVPKGGESVAIGPYRVGITSMAGRRIARVSIETVGARQPV